MECIEELSVNKAQGVYLQLEHGYWRNGEYETTGYECYDDYAVRRSLKSSVGGRWLGGRETVSRHLPCRAPVQVCIKHLLHATRQSHNTITQCPLLNKNIITYKYAHSIFVFLLDTIPTFTKYETRVHDRNTILR